MPRDLSPAPHAPSDFSPVIARRPGWRRLLSDYGPPLLLMALIFLASQDIGSAAHSGRVVEMILTWLGVLKRLTPEQVEVVHYTVRKAGHITEYALLTLLAHRAAAHGRERWTRRLVVGVLAFVSLYAASDEVHQLFVQSRTSSAWDWLLDTVAAALALAAKWRWEWRRRSRSSR